MKNRNEVLSLIKSELDEKSVYIIGSYEGHYVSLFDVFDVINKYMYYGKYEED